MSGFYRPRANDQQPESCQRPARRIGHQTLSKFLSSGTTQYGWDFENRLGSVVLPGSGGAVTFKYDPFGRRIQKAFTQGTTTTTTNYLYDGASDIEEVDQNGNLLARYTQGTGIDEPLAEVRLGTASYYEQDGLGSATSLSSSTGSLANTYIYDGFGNLTASTGNLTNPFQYAGRDYDSETGLRYYRARYYSPETGRFLSEDPVRFKAGIDFYTYVANSPTNLVDPTGLCPPTPNFCTCFRSLIGINRRVVGCTYMCSCPDGLRIAFFKCGLFDQKAFSHCPETIGIYPSNGTIFAPVNKCNDVGPGGGGGW